MARSPFLLVLASLAFIAFLPSCAKTAGQLGEGGGGGEAASCSKRSDAEGSPVAFRFLNMGTEEIYLSTFCNVPGRPSFRLIRDGIEVKIDPVECEGTCGQAQSDVDPYCPNIDCADVGPLLRIEPGGIYAFQWSATEQVLSSMPAACYDGSKIIENQCWQQIELTEAPTLVSGVYMTRNQTHYLSNPPGTFGCPCALAADTDGVCEVDPETCLLYSGDQTLPEATIDLPSNHAVDFRIMAP